MIDGAKLRAWIDMDIACKRDSLDYVHNQRPHNERDCAWYQAQITTLQNMLTYIETLERQATNEGV